MKLFNSYFQENMPEDYIWRAYYPSLLERMDTLTQLEADIIYDYMMNCTVLAEFLGSVEDPMNKNIFIPYIEYTDGAYFWNQINAYVIKAYRIKVPDHFRNHVVKQLDSKQDFSQLNGYKLRNWRDEVIAKFDINKDEIYDIWTEGEIGALVVDFEKILASQAVKPPEGNT